MDVERSYAEAACPLAEGRKHATGCCARIQSPGLQLRLKMAEGFGPRSHYVVRT